MTNEGLRDHFAAAALTGLLAQGDDGSFSEEWYAGAAYRWAEAMLGVRDSRTANKSIHGAAPAAKAQVDAAGISRQGTGDTTLDAAPAARASVESVASQPTTHADSDRTDKAVLRPGEGTGDPVTKPMPKEKRAEVSDGEPVAWAVEGGGFGYVSLLRSSAEYAALEHEFAKTVPLYRSPTLTDAEREAMTYAAGALIALFIETGNEYNREASDAIRGLLERLK